MTTPSHNSIPGWLPFEWLLAFRFLREGKVQTLFIIGGVAIGVLMSGYGLLPVEFGPLPLAAGQHLAQMLHRMPHVGKAGVERR